jgi:hypothetical protein
VREWSTNADIFSKQYTSIDSYLLYGSILGNDDLQCFHHIEGSSKVIACASGVFAILDYKDSSIDEVIHFTSASMTEFYDQWFMPGKRLIFNANANADVTKIYKLPLVGCSDPRALTCHEIDATESLTCVGNLVIDVGTGLCRCPDPIGSPLTGFFWNEVSQTCEGCIGGCEVCSAAGPGSCLACPPTAMFDGTTCTCPGEFWLDMGGGGVGACSACYQDCSDCTGSLNGDCTDCKPGFVLESGTCNTPPPSSSVNSSGIDGFNINLITLSNKDVDLLTNEDLGPGIETSEAYKAITISPREDNLVGKSELCTPTNPRKYTDPLDGLCKTCDPRCFRCAGPTHGDCVECMPGWYEEGGYCLDCSEVSFGSANGPRCENELEFTLLNRRLNSEALNLTILI